jgi:hypothetical protein
MNLLSLSEKEAAEGDHTPALILKMNDKLGRKCKYFLFSTVLFKINKITTHLLCKMNRKQIVTLKNSDKRDVTLFQDSRII